MRIREVMGNNLKVSPDIEKLEDPLKRKARKLKDEAEKYDDKAKERKQREQVDTARENLRDKERKLAGGAPK